jgi:hypothetical protein
MTGFEDGASEREVSAMRRREVSGLHGVVNRRSFLTTLAATAGGILLPWEPERVYSFARELRVPGQIDVPADAMFYIAGTRIDAGQLVATIDCVTIARGPFLLIRQAEARENGLYVVTGGRVRRAASAS